MTWCQINPIDTILYCRYWFLVIYEWQNFHLSFWTCHNICMRNTCRSCHFTNGSTCTSVWQGSTQLWIWNLHLLFMTSNSGLLLPQLERRFGNFFGLKKSSHANVTYPLATIDNKKVQMKDQHAHVFQDLTHASNLEGLFHSHQNLVEISSRCSMDDAHYTMHFPIGKRRWML